MPRQKRALETRARIVAAAGALFASKGYRATRVADVAKEAGCALGALQFHFPNKVLIATAVIEEQHRMVMDAAASVSQQRNTSGIDDLILVSSKLARLIAQSSIVRAGLRLSTESVDDLGISAAKPYLDWISHCVLLLKKAQIEGEISTTVVLQDLAEVIIASFTGTQFLSAALSEGTDLPERLAKLWPILLAPVGDSAHLADRVSVLLEGQVSSPA